MLSLDENPWYRQQLEKHPEPAAVPGLWTLYLRCQGYLRMKVRPVPPATWLYIPFSNRRGQQGLLVYLWKGGRRERPGRYETYSGVQGPIGSLSTCNSINGQGCTQDVTQPCPGRLILSVEARAANQWDEYERPAKGEAKAKGWVHPGTDFHPLPPRDRVLSSPYTGVPVPLVPLSSLCTNCPLCLDRSSRCTVHSLFLSIFSVR